ncbi:protein INSYN2B isoform X1 [Athene cunicularia]|uniref:Inhibitory synaptic factor family member 2B n=1 Tax=Athene cunicularia TaxID=194338 RepID=A0A663MXC9_ATHCN|nr:protein INSYN2B isoform X1 [Athene cunicularia]XP_026714103.1 protein INSYN2B isoform X1 [Athene cunicularia]
MTNEMGRKETRYLQTLNCDSMAQQNMKMRPVLLKRNSLDSADFMREPHHRRTKSQQVRFKDDGVNTKSELDTNPAQDIASTTGKTEIFWDHSFLLHHSPSFPRAQKGFRNIAIQTSPSLRKHFPVFKKKKLTVSKSLTEMPMEPANSIQVNGNLSEQDMSSDLCYLRITNHLEDGFRNSDVDGQLSQRPSKAQSNGPIHSDDFSVSEKTTVSTQVPEYIHVSFPQDSNASMDAPDTTANLSNSLHSSTVINSNENNDNSTLSSNSEKAYPCLSNFISCSECNPHSDSCEADKSDSESLVASKDASSKETTPLSPPSNHSSSPCFLRDYQQAGEHRTDSSCVTLTNDDHTIMSLTSSNASKSFLSCKTETKKNSTQSDVSQCNSCLEGFHIKSYLPRNETKPQTNKEISEINKIHLAHGELCALQGRLQSVEESLQSNQEKIKVLLNVIQDLEKSRALSEGRNFYHTGQDLNNCSTCQNTACIIYSVEYDFRQQEGRFHQILKTLDHAEQNSASASPQKQPSDHPAPEKKELRRKTKKVKRKCFWWI